MKAALALIFVLFFVFAIMEATNSFSMAQGNDDNNGRRGRSDRSKLIKNKIYQFKPF